MPLTDSSLALGVVILAAGRSARMGRPKLLLPWGKTSVLGHQIQQWEELRANQITLVIRANDAVLQAELDRLRFPTENLIDNSAAERGMFSSIQCAAQWAGWRKSLTHWVIVLGDQPHLRPSTFEKLLAFVRAKPENVVQPLRYSKGRHPVVLPKSTFIELAASTSENLREFLLGRKVAGWECDDPGLDLDIDRPQDYHDALALAGWKAETINTFPDSTAR